MVSDLEKIHEAILVSLHLGKLGEANIRVFQLFLLKFQYTAKGLFMKMDIKYVTTMARYSSVFIS